MSVVTVAKSAAGVRGLGCKPNPAKKADEKPDRVFTPRLSARTSAPKLLAAAAVVIADCVVRIFDQGATSSCVAQAICGAIAARELFLSRLMGRGTERKDLFAAAYYGQLARRALYSLARATHGDQKNDGGTYIRAALDWLRKHGCALERDFEWSELKINQTVPAPLLHEGYAFAELEYEAIVAVGSDKIEQIRSALLEGYPVVFGTNVTRSFGRLRKHTTPYAPGAIDVDPVLGGHAMYIVDVDTNGHCTIVNSWGTGWGNDGRALVHRDWAVRSFRDLTIIKGWRRVQAAEAEVRRAA